MKISENELIDLEDECRDLAGQCVELNGSYPYLYREIIDWTRDDISYDELMRDKGIYVSVNGDHTRLPHNEYVNQLSQWKRYLENKLDNTNYQYVGISKSLKWVY